MNYSSARIFVLTFVSIILASTHFASAQIVAFGHSGVQGGKVMPDEAWPAVLESLLHARGSQVHVINAGFNGETTDRGLARIDSAIPDGTKLVLFMYTGSNDGRAGHQASISGSADPRTNIMAMKNRIKARGIQLIDVTGLYRSVFRQPGMKMVDGKHLNVEGNRKLAATLAGMV